MTCHPQRTVLVLGSESDRRRVCDELAHTWYVLGCEIDSVSRLMRAVIVDVILVIAPPSEPVVARVERGIVGTRLSMTDVIFVQDPERVSEVRDRIDSISGTTRKR